MQAHDQYVLERMALPHGPLSDFVLVNLFAEPLGAPMSGDAITQLLGRLSRRAKLERIVTPRMLRRAAGSSAVDAGGGHYWRAHHVAAVPAAVAASDTSHTGTR
ncbi:hypothetical protein [Streptomyces sp. NPDC059389]|uniref:hypothetical protein n=1 Tax=Streptomyces sp. NPDC059389 TaxID=3346818 RepID=UPI0036B1CB0B